MGAFRDNPRSFNHRYVVDLEDGCNIGCLTYTDSLPDESGTGGGDPTAVQNDDERACVDFQSIFARICQK